MNVLVLGGNRKSWRASDRFHDRDYTTGVEAWVYAFDGDYCHTLEARSERINSYDLIIANSNSDRYRPKLLQLQRKRKKGIRWVTLVEGGAIDYLALDAQTKELFDGSDLVNLINRHSIDFFRACTTARCEYIGIPYPAAGIRNQFKAGDREDVWISSNLYHPRASGASALAVLPVMRKMGKHAHGFMRPPRKAHGIHRLFSVFGRSKNSDLNYGELLKDIQFHRPMPMRSYLQTISDTAYAFVNLDHRYTWARDVLDCAAMQIPCIATISTGHVLDYFPALSVPNEFAISEASDLLERLYADKEFYEECARVPIEKFEHLSHERMKEKLLAALGM